MKKTRTPSRAAAVALEDRRHQLRDRGAIGEAEHRPHLIGADPAAAIEIGVGDRAHDAVVQRGRDRDEVGQHLGVGVLEPGGRV